MSHLVAAVFNDEYTGFEVRAALGKMQKEYLLEMDDAVADNEAELRRALEA